MTYCVLKIKELDKEGYFYKLFRRTYKEWRLNSGIVDVEESPDYWVFHGVSGSRYEIPKDAPYTDNDSTVLNWVEHFQDKMVIMPENTDWTNLDFNIEV